MTHDVFALIANRKTYRRFSPKPVEMDKILQIVQAGTLAPSSGNIQNWSFIVVSDVEKIRALYPYAMEQEAFLSANAAIIVIGNIQYAQSMYGVRGKTLYTVQNCAAAIENMLLASGALDIGAVWIGAFNEDKVMDMFAILPAYKVQAIVLLGYPAAEITGREPKPLEDVVYFNKFGNKVLKPHLIFYDWATEWRMQGQKLARNVETMKQKYGKQEKSEQDKTEQEQQPPKKSAMQQARERVHSTIESLKKDEYRKK